MLVEGKSFADFEASIDELVLLYVESSLVGVESVDGVGDIADGLVQFPK